jgi:hypothetical protein
MDHQTYDPLAHRATAVFLPSAGQGGALGLSVDGGASTPNGQSFAVPAAGLALTGATERCVDGGTLVTLVGNNLCGTPYARYPIALASLAPGDGLTDPLRVDVSSSELVREGALQADGSDLAVVASDGVTPLLVFADTPVGPDQRLFVRWPAGDGGMDSLGNQVDPGPFAVGASGEVAGGLGAVFPELADGGLLLWLRAEVSDVGDGGGASVWPDSARGNTAVAGNGAATWQANGIGDWPALDFNGSSDEYDVGAGLGVGSFTLFAVYWDPDGGGTTYPRLVSAAPEGGTDYGVGGTALWAPRDATTALETPQPTPQLIWANAPDGTDATHLRIAAASGPNPGGFYGGLLSEVMVFGPQLTTVAQQQVEADLNRKYGLTPAGRGTVAVDAPIPPMTVTVGGVDAQIVAIDGGSLQVLVPSVCLSGSAESVVVTADGASATLALGGSTASSGARASGSTSAASASGGGARSTGGRSGSKASSSSFGSSPFGNGTSGGELSSSSTSVAASSTSGSSPTLAATGSLGSSGAVAGTTTGGGLASSGASFSTAGASGAAAGRAASSASSGLSSSGGAGASAVASGGGGQGSSHPGCGCGSGGEAIEALAFLAIGLARGRSRRARSA